MKDQFKNDILQPLDDNDISKYQAVCKMHLPRAMRSHHFLKLQDRWKRMLKLPANQHINEKYRIIVNTISMYIEIKTLKIVHLLRSVTFRKYNVIFSFVHLHFKKVAKNCMNVFVIQNEFNGIISLFSHRWKRVMCQF